MAADQELHGGLAVEFKRLNRVYQRSRGEVSLRGILSPPRVGQRIAEAGPEPPGFLLAGAAAQPAVALWQRMPKVDQMEHVARDVERAVEIGVGDRLFIKAPQSNQPR